LPDAGGGDRLLLLRTLRTTTRTGLCSPGPRTFLSLDGARSLPLPSFLSLDAIFTTTRLFGPAGWVDAPSRPSDCCPVWSEGRTSAPRWSARYSGPAPGVSSWAFVPPPGAGRISPKSSSSSMSSSNARRCEWQTIWA